MLPRKIDITKKPWVKILIHSDSFEQSSKNAAFLDLQNTTYAQIDVTPTLNEKSIAFFLSVGIEVPQYKISNGSIAMYYSNGFKNAAFYPASKEGVDNHGVCSLSDKDKFMSSRYDILLANIDSEPKEDSHVSNIANLEQTKSFLRILFANNNVYLHRHNQYLDEGWHYLLRFKTVFDCYQDPWTLIVYLRDQFPTINKAMGSLSSRLNFILRAYEKVIYYSLDMDGADSHSLVLYHLGFFVMLCTGAFDDIAWINNNLHDFRLHRTRVSLRGKPFQKKLKIANLSLFSLLQDQQMKESLESFYPIRDSLQHRNYLSSYTAQSFKGRSQMIYMEKDAAKYLLS